MDETFRPGRTVSTRVRRLHLGENACLIDDEVASEEPLQLRLRAGGEIRPLAVTMRTPGNDFELAAGFCFGESIVRTSADILGISYCTDANLDEAQRYNVVNVDLNARQLPDVTRFERHFTMTSACGVCGRASLDDLEERGITPLADAVRVEHALLATLPDVMKQSQRIFAQTGGLHAAGLFDTEGTLLALREDIGRHNAVDKIVGWALIQNSLPLAERILVVSGRASYEILQKVATARIPILCAVSAPSSLAVELARRFGITLLGFVCNGRANVYAGVERLR